MPRRPAAEGVRAGYEHCPYPAVTRETVRCSPWLLPSVEWIQSVAPTAPGWPGRILVAGCGTGAEAFAMRRRFPEAEVVGIDFSAASIRIARRLQQRGKDTRSIRFLRGDLRERGLAQATGGDFDFVSCHGVLSYVAPPGRVLRNLAACLAPTGLLYLGVNGAAHFSERWRKFLPGFGHEMDAWRGGKPLWRDLELTACLEEATKVKVLEHGVAYLASDLFGPVFQNFSLGEWVRLARQAGLHLCGREGMQRRLWPAINADKLDLFLPRPRGAVAELLDRLQPGAFHALIFSRRAELSPPWFEHRALLRWRPSRTSHLAQFRWPVRVRFGVVALRNRRANIEIELRGAGWEIDVLRAGRGELSLREILAQTKHRVTPSALRSQLYLFYLLELLNLLPPAKQKNARKLRRTRQRPA